MSSTTRKLEKKWIANFKRSKLINQESQTLRKDLARAIFYGGRDSDTNKDVPLNFQTLYGQCSEIAQGEAVNEIQRFLSFVGIDLSIKKINGHLIQFPDDFEKLCRKCYYILRTIAHAGSNFSIDNPFKDIAGDIFFFLRIETGESVGGGQLHLFEDIELPELYRRVSVLPAGYEDEEFVQRLFQSIEMSNTSFFITGKAGTGKSTFVHYFSQKTRKQVLMLAFTGIAAMNIGGQTIHSFFRLPFKPLLPDDDDIKTFRKESEKYQIIKSIDTIIIDEVSMLRSDVLDAIDTSLRRNGGDPNKIFGGKQILFIGDIFQLPPVVDTGDGLESLVFKDFYASEYFFDAHSYKAINPVLFEFTKSHRQGEDKPFVELLDEVRTCQPSDTTLRKLNERVNSGYIPNATDFVINLTSTNDIAQAENERQLHALYTQEYVFDAEITDEFAQDKFPTARKLELKKGAQVIFVKNDIGCSRWVNGTIGKVDFISDDIIEVRLQNGEIHQVQKATWENRQYSYNKDEKKIISTVVGTFTQFPLKLAWAITIHKSQSLTFNNLTIDIGRGAFINGQVYTALSRCRKLDGIILKREIRKQDIITDKRILDFYQRAV